METGGRHGTIVHVGKRVVYDVQCVCVCVCVCVRYVGEAGRDRIHTFSHLSLHLEWSVQEDFHSIA